MVVVVPDYTRLKYNTFVSLPNEIFNGPALYMIRKKHPIDSIRAGHVFVPGNDQCTK